MLGSNLEPDFRMDGISFLIVDDNKHMRLLVRTILNAFGAKNCAEAADGADAFKELKHFEADIIICDWAMHPLDGLDFLRMVRTGRDSPNPFVPVIMLTAHTEAGRVMEARDAGVNEVLAKPISASDLYSRVRQIVHHPRPFIRAKRYFGPDRRRGRRDMAYRGPDRRTGNAEADVLKA